MCDVCEVCMHHCRLKPGDWGICRARKNEGGSIVCKNYGELTSIALDAIEKKPLAMFYPGSRVLSVGSFGCNLRCPFCQNHEISMARENEIPTRYVAPEELAEQAERYVGQGNIGIAFTYNEPLVGWEYVLDTAKLIHDSGMKNVVVTNGTLSPDILRKLLPCIDAMNIDLKGFDEAYYRRLGGDFNAVREFIQIAADSCHVELTTLIVPGENDAVSDMEAEAEWIASVRRDIPLHVTRFFPRYHMTDRPPTDVEHIHRLARAVRRILPNVFVGNC